MFGPIFHLNTNHIQGGDQRQLYRIINDHADKQDITWIFIEETVLAESGHHTAVKDTERQPHKHGHNVFSESSAETVPRYGIQEE